MIWLRVGGRVHACVMADAPRRAVLGLCSPPADVSRARDLRSTPRSLLMAFSGRKWPIRQPQGRRREPVCRKSLYFIRRAIKANVGISFLLFTVRHMLIILIYVLLRHQQWQHIAQQHYFLNSSKGHRGLGASPRQDTSPVRRMNRLLRRSTGNCAPWGLCKPTSA